MIKEEYQKLSKEIREKSKKRENTWDKVYDALRNLLKEVKGNKIEFSEHMCCYIPEIFFDDMIEVNNYSMVYTVYLDEKQETIFVDCENGDMVKLDSSCANIDRLWYLYDTCVGLCKENFVETLA